MSDLERVLRTLRRRAWLIFLCVVIAAGAAVAFSLTQEKKYTAEASLLFRDPGIDKNLFQSNAADTTDAQRQAATNLRLVSLPDVAERTSKRLGGHPTESEIERNVSVSSEGQSDIVAIKATDKDPATAATVANTFAGEFIASRREADQAVIRRAQQVVRNRLSDVSAPDRRTLQSRADDLKILAALQTGKAELVQLATAPSSPSSPKSRRNAVIGGFLGFLLGIALAFLFDRLDRRLKDPAELEETYRMPVLGAVPEIKALRNGTRRKENGYLPGPEWETFRKLRAKLRYFNVDRSVRSVLVTSAAPEEGKTTVATNLALAAAIAGQSKVLLLEADLRRPGLATKLDLAPIPGLAELLTHNIVTAEATQQFTVPWSTRPTSLDVIVAGEIPPNPSELLESRRMSELLATLNSTYDLVIIDTPPVSVVADAMPLVRHVDGVIVVSWIGHSTRDAALHVRHELESLKAPTLGVVINRLKTGADSYYGYGGGEPLDLRSFERVT
jgi:polysaccharide biosynthesis transport protein